MNNKILEPEEILQVVKTAKRQVGQYVKSGDILGFREFGSIARGSFNIRSDWQAIIVVSKEFLYSKELTDFIVEINNQGLLFDPDIVTTQLLRSNIHTYGLDLLQHIGSLDDQTIIGVDPLSFVGAYPDNKETLRNYLAFKHRRLIKGLVRFNQLPEDQQIELARRILETPYHVGRKIIKIIYKSSADQKPAVIREYKRNIKNQTVIKNFQLLIDADRQYSKELNAMIKLTGNGNIRNIANLYYSSLAKIEEAGQTAIEFIEQNARILEKITRAL